jgi:hypothetical protein
MLKRLLLASILFSTTFAVASSSEAREWTIVGPRALGMGGAGVAVANDATASYWNPAAFGFFKDSTGGEYGKRTWSATLDAGFGAQVHEDLGEQIDIISGIDFNQFTAGDVTIAEMPNFIEMVSQLKTFDDNPDRALTVTVNGGLRTQFGHFGLGGYAFADISAKGDLDLVNIGPTNNGTATFDIAEVTDPATYGCGGACASTDYFSAPERTQLETFLTGLGWTAGQATDFINIVENGIAALPPADVPASSEVVTQVQNVATVVDAAATDGGGTGGTIDQNESKLIFRGLAVAEVPLTYGRKITDDFAVGGNIKYMKARVYNTEVPVFNTDFGDALNTATDTYAESSNFGIDLGALYRFGDKLRFGVVARNINSPSFDMVPLTPGGEDSIKEEPQVRAGVAYRPFSSLILAADIDLTENETTVSGTSTSRIISAGIEGNLFNFLQLRGGIYKNIANEDIGPVYTAGLGINLWAVNIDFGAAMSSGSTTVDGNEIPKEVKAELALSALF